MQTFGDVISKWETASDLGAVCGVDAGTVRSWKARDSIPPQHFPAIVRDPVARKHNVTMDRLFALQRPRKRKARAA